MREVVAVLTHAGLERARATIAELQALVARLEARPRPGSSSSLSGTRTIRATTYPASYPRPPPSAQERPQLPQPRGFSRPLSPQPMEGRLPRRRHLPTCQAELSGGTERRRKELLDPAAGAGRAVAHRVPRTNLTGD